MSLAKAIRRRREASRGRRELNQAISSAVSSGLRDELILASQRDLAQRER